MANKKATLYPSSVSQPNVNQKHPITKWAFREVRRGGDSYDLGSANPNDPRYFHGWTNMNELKTGGKAQCGRPSTYHCSHATYYGIKGYRNTCPIAGCNGTYNTPATLQLHLSEKALKNKGIVNGSEIKKVTISFQHRCSGVDVANGQETYKWGPNFYGYKTYPKLKVLKLYITNSSGNTVSNVITKDSNGNDFTNPPLNSKFTKAGTITATFKNISYSDLKNGALNIVYGRNLSTNPGNIYISSAKITIEYSNAKATITGKNDTDTLYTSKATACQTPIYQTITAGYKNGNNWIPIANAPKDLIKDDIVITKPNGVNVTYDSKSGRNIKYKVIDETGAIGTKKITYTIKNTSASTTLQYTAKTRTKPDIILYNQLKYDLNEEEAANKLIIKNGCCDNIKIYVDNLTEEIAEITSSDFDYETIENILPLTKATNIIKMLSKYSCGLHTAFFVRDNEPTTEMISIPFYVVPRKYEFKFSTAGVGQNKTYVKGENENSFELIQDKTNTDQIIYIQRVDNETPETTPNFIITDNTLNENKELNTGESSPIEMDNGDEETRTISKYISGDYYISIVESNESCINTQDIRNIHIEPNHKQNHDFIFIRGEDSTSFDYDYIVAWEGDEVREPIDVTDVELVCQYDDIKICAYETNTAGISQTGNAQIKITNASQYQKDFNNVKIELNILRKNEDGILEVTTDEFFELDGMLLNFVENFNIANKDILSNVSIVNLTEDGDYEDEENVYIHIKELKYDTTIVVNIPFICRTDKEIYIQPLVLGQPMKVYQFNGCSGTPFDYICLETYDSILTNMEILGNFDYLEPNISTNYLTGASQDQCPNECFITKNNMDEAWDTDGGGITYKIQNVDSNTIEQTSTIIHNDENLIPFGIIYYKNGTKYTKIIDNSYTPNTSDKVYWTSTADNKKINLINTVIDVYINFPNTEEQLLKKRTDSNGNIKFYVTIPEHSTTNYTLSTLLSNVLCIFYEGNDINKHAWSGKLNTTVTEIISKKKTASQERIAELKAVRSGLDSTAANYSEKYQYITNAINNIETDTRNTITITPIDNYRRYRPGDTIEITAHIESELEFMDNNIIFKPDIQNPGDTDEITVFYKVCNLENNTGILNTEFRTNHKSLIQNKIDRDIYFGINTNLESKVSIEKRIVEQNTLNVIHTYLFNRIRDNKDIRCVLDLGIYPNDNRFGSYDFINIEIEDGDYNIVTVDESYTKNNETINYQHLYIEWNIGEMKADTNTKATIFLKGHDVGLSEILVDTYDYLHDGTAKTYHFGEYLCNCRRE